MSIKIHEPVETIMTRQPYCVNVEDSIMDVHNIMTKHSIRHIPVVIGDELIGIVSKHDLDKFLLKGDGYKDNLSALSVSKIMTKKVRSVQVDDSIKDAAELLSLASYHALPVMDGNKLAGIVTSTDLIIYLLKHYDY